MNTFPPIPFPLVAGEDLTVDQQQANLEHVARFILAHQEFFNMSSYHQWSKRDENGWKIDPYEHPCRTTHCIAGTAQIMAGLTGREIDPGYAGLQLLGPEAYEHFYEENEDALAYLRAVLQSS